MIGNKGKHVEMKYNLIGSNNCNNVSSSHGAMDHDIGSSSSSSLENSRPMPLMTAQQNSSMSLEAAAVNIADNDVQLLSQSSLFSCYSNLTSTIIGAGVLGLPKAMSQCGWILGSILILLCGFASGMSLHFLSVCCKKSIAPYSFYSVAEVACPQASFLIDIAVALKCYGVATSYLIVVGDNMPMAMRTMQYDGFWLNRVPWVIIAFALVAPLSCFQSLDALKYTSSLSILFILFISVLVVLYSMGISGLAPCEGMEDNCSGNRMLFATDSSALSAITIFVFGYTCQQNCFSVINELEQPTQARMNKLFSLSIGTAVFLYFAVAYSGYLTYGDHVLSDLLRSYPSNAVTGVARVFVSLIVSFHYPLQVNPGRKSILSLWKHFSGGTDPSPNTFRIRYIIITVIFLFTSLIIAVSVSDLGIMLGIVGATGSTIVSYILPGLFYYLLHKEEGPIWKRNVAVAICGCGCVIMPLAFFFIVYKATPGH